MDGRQIPGPPGAQAPYSLPPSSDVKANGMMNGQPDKALLRAQQEVDLLNHCFEEIETFMARLQKAAEAQSVLEQRNKKKRRSRVDDDPLIAKAKVPPKDEFVQIFQKFKYSFCLLGRLKSVISNPTSEELLHYLFKPLDMMVKTTGGPALASSVTSPLLTVGGITLLKENLTLEEHKLWSSLGAYWTQPRSALNISSPPYFPVFMNGWRPAGSDADGWMDPIQAEHRRDTERENQKLQGSLQPPSSPAVPVTPVAPVALAAIVAPVALVNELNSNTETETDGAPPQERLYSCSYDFVARNSSELSVLQGETLEVVEASKRWWKCRNRFNEVGFVPFNILEPLSHVESAMSNKSPKAPSPPTMLKTSTLPLPTSLGVPTADFKQRPRSIALPPQHSPADSEKVMQVNDELLKRLTSGKAPLNRSLVIPRSAETAVPLDYHSPPAEVETWLQGKGFSESTVQCLRVLTGAQLFSLNKEELRAVIPDEGPRVYSQLTVQKSLLEDVHKASELETVMEKQKMKVDLTVETGTL
ncbi:epidermal growth factor receptor kinase substrate 8-like protein 1 [Trichomycterus rosablanca]|uniref:epidermal growth factor receptor kinase substrate 8-like protein 1 n=1 Tax=Trichomycterus rosablanca TaxID=2290929 RepID=UPI002F35CBE5